MNCIYTHRNYWKCLQVHKTYEVEELSGNEAEDLHVVEQKFIGSAEPPPERFETRNCYPVQNTERLTEIAIRLQQLRFITNLSAAPNRVCYVYDSQMAEHRNLFEEWVIEFWSIILLEIASFEIKIILCVLDTTSDRNV